MLRPCQRPERGSASPDPVSPCGTYAQPRSSPDPRCQQKPSAPDSGTLVGQRDRCTAAWEREFSQDVREAGRS